MSCWNAIAQTGDLDKYPMHSFCEIWQSASPNVPQSDRPRFGFVRTSKNAVSWRAVLPSTGVLRPFRSKLSESFDNFPPKVKDLLNRTPEREIFRRQLRTVWNDSPVWIDRDSYRVALVGEAGRVGELGTLHHGTYSKISRMANFLTLFFVRLLACYRRWLLSCKFRD